MVPSGTPIKVLELAVFSVAFFFFLISQLSLAFPGFTQAFFRRAFLFSGFLAEAGMRPSNPESHGP